MKILISWSGDVSHRAALELRDWIALVLPFAETWVSSEDIQKGSRWGAQLAAELQNTDCGILCVTPGNIGEPWLNFEAGALSKAVNVAQVHPFLLGLRPGDLEGPLEQFQATGFTQAEVRKLIDAINAAAGAEALASDKIGRNFRKLWPNLETALTPIMADAASGQPTGDIKADANVSGEELSEQELSALKFMADADARVFPPQVAQEFQMHPARARHVLERLVSADFAYRLVNLNTGPSYTLSDKGRAELVKRNLV